MNYSKSDNWITTSNMVTTPKYTGYWQHGNTSLAMMKKPRWLTRVMMRLVFETTWKDNTEK
jgi:hypothetical protein